MLSMYDAKTLFNTTHTYVGGPQTTRYDVAVHANDKGDDNADELFPVDAHNRSAFADF